MENTSTTLKFLEQMIEELACYNNPGQTAVKAAHGISNDYVLIRRRDLPVVEVKNGTGRLSHITEHASQGDTNVMRELAYQYLAMADYVDSTKKAKEEEELRDNRLNVWMELNPTPFGTIFYKDSWKWDSLKLSERKAIDLILSLQKNKIDS